MIEKHVSAILQNRKSSVQRIKNCIAFCTILLNLSVPTSISTISKSDKDYYEAVHYDTASLGLKSMRHSHILGVSVVEFEHRHCFLICQRGV